MGEPTTALDWRTVRRAWWNRFVRRVRSARDLARTAAKILLVFGIACALGFAAEAIGQLKWYTAAAIPLGAGFAFGAAWDLVLGARDVADRIAAERDSARQERATARGEIARRDAEDCAPESPDYERRVAAIQAVKVHLAFAAQDLRTQGRRGRAADPQRVLEPVGYLLQRALGPSAEERLRRAVEQDPGDAAPLTEKFPERGPDYECAVYARECERIAEELTLAAIRKHYEPDPPGKPLPHRK